MTEPLGDPTLVDARDIAAALSTDAERGLSSTEALSRLARDGPNRLDAERQVPAWRTFAAQFADPLIYLLLAAIAVSVAAWALEGPSGLPVEAIVIALIVLGNGARSEHGSALRELLANPRLLGAVALSVVLQVLVVVVPFLNSAFGTVPLSGIEWAGCVAIASAVLWAEELKKALAGVRRAPLERFHD